MKNIKMAVWVFLLFIVQTVLINYIKIAGARPDLVLPFIVCVALMEDSYRSAMTVSLICAAAAASLCGRNFTLSLLFYAYTAVAVFNTRPRRLPDFVKYLFYVLFGSLFLETASYIMLYSSFGGFAGAFVKTVIPVAVYDMAGALVMYPFMRRVVYGKNLKRKRLI